MALWSFPIVCDLVAEAYGREIGVRHASLRMFAFCHSQLWQAMLLDDHAAGAKARAEVTSNLKSVGLRPSFVDEVNELVLDELMDVVAQRFQRTPHRARLGAHILLHIAKNLAYTPEALAAA